MLYGDQVNPYYVRALKSHRRHNDRWNYGMHILQQDIVGGYWNKPSYLMSLIVNELAKPAAERVEWFMYVVTVCSGRDSSSCLLGVVSG